MLFVKVWLITFVLSCIWIFPQPRYYNTKVSIAPESSDAKDMGGIASLASNFGLNIGNGSNDAIYPQLYPDLFKSTDFLVGLLDINIQTKDGAIKTDYYTYIKEKQKDHILLAPIHAFQDWAINLFAEKEQPLPAKGGKRFDPFRLSKETTDVLKAIQGKIDCTYSRTTDVVTITVEDQDPLVCALMADSIKEHLQIFITDYRTKKARIDYEHYKELTLMEEELKRLTTREGKPYRLVPLPMAAPMYDEEGGRLPATYANFLITNGAVLMPTYAHPQLDHEAREQLQKAFPEYEIVGIDCRVLVTQHGSLHCSTMQFPC